MALSTQFDDALAFAADAHRRQVRKGSGIPYLSHLLAVAALVIENGGTEAEAIAALLHDAVEDQGGAAMRETIRSRFGDAVAEIVDGCSDTDAQPKPPWRERKEAYLRHLANASPSVLLVSAADKVHNARSILTDHRREGHAVWGRFTASREQTLWYYRSLVEAYRARRDVPRIGPLFDELDRTVSDLEALGE